MERPFFLTLEGLWFFSFLALGHALGYPIVVFVRRRRYNDFVAVMLACVGLALGGLADVWLGVWFIHSAGFGVLMGTVTLLASDLGRIPSPGPETPTMSDSQEWPEIIMFGTSWCGDCHRSRQLLDSANVPYTYHDVEEENLEDLVIKLNEEAGFGPRRRVPTLTIDGETFSVPSNAELSARLGI